MQAVSGVELDDSLTERFADRGKGRAYGRAGSPGFNGLDEAPYLVREAIRAP